MNRYVVRGRSFLPFALVVLVLLSLSLGFTKLILETEHIGGSEIYGVAKYSRNWFLFLGLILGSLSYFQTSLIIVAVCGAALLILSELSYFYVFVIAALGGFAALGGPSLMMLSDVGWARLALGGAAVFASLIAWLMAVAFGWAQPMRGRSFVGEFLHLTGVVSAGSLAALRIGTAPGQGLLSYLGLIFWPRTATTPQGRVASGLRIRSPRALLIPLIVISPPIFAGLLFGTLAFTSRGSLTAPGGAGWSLLFIMLGLAYLVGAYLLAVPVSLIFISILSLEQKLRGAVSIPVALIAAIAGPAPFVAMTILRGNTATLFVPIWIAGSLALFISFLFGILLGRVKMEMTNLDDADGT
jgi:hypothetical protein